MLRLLSVLTKVNKYFLRITIVLVFLLLRTAYLIAGNNFSGNTILIHRIKFLPEDRSLPIEMERSQFPGMVTKMVFVKALYFNKTRKP